MKCKKICALLLAVLMTVTLCVPVLAAEADEEYCTCEDAWLENPSYGDWEFQYSGPNADVYIREVVWTCSQCGLSYVEYESMYVPHG